MSEQPTPIQPKRREEKFRMEVKKGALVPVDNYTASRLRLRNYHTGDVLECRLKKVNNPKFHRLIHRIGQLAANNIEDFTGMDAHAVLKRIQLEANIGCDEVAVTIQSAWGQFEAAMLSQPALAILAPAMRVIGSMLPAHNTMIVRYPASLSFDSMDDGERHEVARAICRYIAETYWPSMTPEAIEEMAESFVEET